MSKDDINRLIELDLEVPKKMERREKDANNRKTYDEVFDHATLLIISKLISDKIIDTVDYPVSSGKEANIFKGTQPDGNPVALKIYRLATATFKNLLKYIDGDRRFKNIRHDHRSLIYAWAKKEFKNLQRMAEAGIRVPKPIVYRKNILVMEFIGDSKLSAPEMRNVHLGNPSARYKHLNKQIQILYKKAGLVHGDMSEYNVLVNEDELVIIDVGQAVLVDHPMADNLLAHDLQNIAYYFKRIYGVKVDAEKVYNSLLKTAESR